VTADECSRANLDRLLDVELQRTLGRIEGPSPEVSESAYHAAFLAGRKSTLPVSLLRFSGSKKTIIGIVAAVGLTTGSTALASSGSANPQAWGRAVTAAVADCKGQLAEAHSIGDCVSSVARQRGEEQRAPGSSRSSSGDGRANPPAGSRLESMTGQGVQGSESRTGPQGREPAGQYRTPARSQPGSPQGKPGRSYGQGHTGGNGGGDGLANRKSQSHVGNSRRSQQPKP